MDAADPVEEGEEMKLVPARLLWRIPLLIYQSCVCHFVQDLELTCSHSGLPVQMSG